MVEDYGLDITEGEAALYDRQIRLWGLDAQKRIRGSRILLAGIGGLGAEISKNIVLAGIKSLTLVDCESVTVDDSSAQFLCVREDIGKNRAMSSLARLQKLNPMVAITALEENIANKPAEFYDDFDTVCITNQPLNVLEKIDQICREKNKFFFAADCFGFFGYGFFDLGKNHAFTEEIFPVGDAVDIDADEPITKKKKVIEELQTIKSEMSFVGLKEVLEIDWQDERRQKRLKRFTENYFIANVLQEFRSRVGRVPKPNTRDPDQELLHQIAGEFTNKWKLGEDKIGNKFISLCFSELAPVCAIVGGILAQEIIKAVSHKDRPLANFFFHSLDGEGIVENIG